ncbi:unnamed protein product [Microthlaspi erraticum]|uniref:Major facilitator superfamily (MFS) profile domain-containing protein n=1 Tax=Microthlaspi erraticum TaxID=1685480 RepID=A0A6D2IA10_9BRAS|nr:unnamed protein product [Microthlaspi erraticum]
MEKRLGGLRHMLTTVFLSAFASFLVTPVITDVTVAAVCSDPNDSCSFAVYLTGVQQVVLFDMVCHGAVDCLAQAYVAKNIPGRKRITMFGVLGGVKSLSAICATFSARFLPVASIFQVSAISLFVGLVYMRVFLQERLHDDDDEYYDDDNDGGGDLRMLAEPILQDAPTTTHVFNNKYSSLKDMVYLMKNSTILVQALVITFIASFSNSGFQSAFMYFLKARFGFDKNDFAQILLLISIIALISQLFILPVMVSAIGERSNSQCFMVSMGEYDEEFAIYVPYATTVLIPGFMLVMPSVYGIASRQVGSDEQGKVQGCIYAVKSFGEVAAPFVFSPLTALFLSEKAPFYYPGFSLLCVALSMMIGFLLSLMIKDVPSPSLNSAISNTSMRKVDKR